MYPHLLKYYYFSRINFDLVMRDEIICRWRISQHFVMFTRILIPNTIIVFAPFSLIFHFSFLYSSTFPFHAAVYADPGKKSRGRTFSFRRSRPPRRPEITIIILINIPLVVLFLSAPNQTRVDEVFTNYFRD